LPIYEERADRRSTIGANCTFDCNAGLRAGHREDSATCV